MSIVKNKEDHWLKCQRRQTGFCNYVGIGVDARVSYAFEMNRQEHKCMNNSVYICCGLSNWCKGIQELANSFEQFSEGDEDSNYNYSPLPLQPPDNLSELQESSEYPSSRKISLKKGYHGMVCLNSLNYMGGVKGVWDTPILGNIHGQTKFSTHSFNDGMIEFLAYKGLGTLVLEALFHTGAKVAQGKGPFHIKFK